MADLGHSPTVLRGAGQPSPGSAPFQPPPRLGRMLGRGGMAAVFLAREEPAAARSRSS
ncbi:MAG: hypothetical protein ACYC8T_26850 [Myxococcaceae bacterium]